MSDAMPELSKLEGLSDEVEGVPIVVDFVGPTGRIYIAGGILCPLVTEGQTETLDPRSLEGLGIKLTGIRVVVDG